jgi:hypothetical protein
MPDEDLDRIIADLRAKREQLAEAMEDAEITRAQRQKLQKALSDLQDQSEEGHTQ